MVIVSTPGSSLAHMESMKKTLTDEWACGEKCREVWGNSWGRREGLRDGILTKGCEGTPTFISEYEQIMLGQKQPKKKEITIPNSAEKK